MVDTTVKVVTIHLVSAIIASILSTCFTLGWLGFKNNVLALAIGVIILYFTGQLCQKQFGEEMEGFRAWLWDGIVPFYFAYCIVWTILVNYL